MARIPLKRVRQFEDAAKGRGKAFAYKRGLNDYVNEIQFPKPLNLNDVEEHMRNAYLLDAKTFLMKRGMVKEADNMPDPAPTKQRTGPVQWGEDERTTKMETYKKAEIQQEIEAVNKAAAKKEARKLALPAPEDSFLHKHLVAQGKMIGEMTGRLGGSAVGAGFGGALGNILGQRRGADGRVPGMVIGLTVGQREGAKYGRKEGERIGRVISKKTHEIGHDIREKTNELGRELLRKSIQHLKYRAERGFEL